VIGAVEPQWTEGWSVARWSGGIARRALRGRRGSGDETVARRGVAVLPTVLRAGVLRVAWRPGCRGPLRRRGPGRCGVQRVPAARRAGVGRAGRPSRAGAGTRSGS